MTLRFKVSIFRLVDYMRIKSKITIAIKFNNAQQSGF